MLKVVGSSSTKIVKDIFKDDAFNDDMKENFIIV